VAFPGSLCSNPLQQWESGARAARLSSFLFLLWCASRAPHGLSWRPAQPSGVQRLPGGPYVSGTMGRRGPLPLVRHRCRSRFATLGFQPQLSAVSAFPDDAQREHHYSPPDLRVSFFFPKQQAPMSPPLPASHSIRIPTAFGLVHHRLPSRNEDTVHQVQPSRIDLYKIAEMPGFWRETWGIEPDLSAIMDRRRRRLEHRAGEGAGGPYWPRAPPTNVGVLLARLHRIGLFVAFDDHALGQL
jgi:hypothetical protein